MKEITFNKETGKWVRIDEGGHKAGCTCAFCKNKGKFGKKGKEEEDEGKEEMDEIADQKIGTAYKVQGAQYKTMDPDFLARTNQYEPEITEMYDDEEECMMNERYVELANAQRNLNEAELAEMNSLREKIDMLAEKKKNWYMLNEKKKKKKNWIKGAINPKHKGYCTPMTKKTCTPKRKALAMRFKKGDLHKEGAEVEENTMHQEMGPAYKEQNRQYRTAEDDFAARVNQFEPKMSEELGNPDVEEPEAGEHEPNRDVSRHEKEFGHPGQPGGYKTWKCDKCGYETTKLGGTKPLPRTWPDGHVCHFELSQGEGHEIPETFHKADQDHFSQDWAEEDEEGQVAEAGGAAVQTTSYRTAQPEGSPKHPHGNLPQSGPQSWAGDVDEGTKPSKVAKTIAKGMKTKKTKKNPLLKFQKAKKTYSGVHKRKT